MSLMKRILEGRLAESREGLEEKRLSSFSISMPGSEQGSGINSIEKQIAEVQGNENRNKKELERYRKFKIKEREDKKKQERLKNKVLSKQPLIPKSLQSKLNKQKDIEQGNDMSPLI